jgi:hypothetical protein
MALIKTSLRIIVFTTVFYVIAASAERATISVINALLK